MEPNYWRWLMWISLVFLYFEGGECVWIPPCQVIVRTKRDTQDIINLSPKFQDPHYKNNDTVKLTMDNHPVNMSASEIQPNEQVGNVAFLIVPTGEHKDPWLTYMIPPLCFPANVPEYKLPEVNDEKPVIINHTACDCIHCKSKEDNLKLQRHPGAHIPLLNSTEKAENTIVKQHTTAPQKPENKIKVSKSASKDIPSKQRQTDDNELSKLIGKILYPQTNIIKNSENISVRPTHLSSPRSWFYRRPISTLRKSSPHSCILHPTNERCNRNRKTS